MIGSVRDTLGAHPRSRGENIEGPAYLGKAEGSSPLTRGKLPHLLDGSNVVGLIPAHAGKTSRSVSAQRVWPAHPRSRGENHVRA